MTMAMPRVAVDAMQAGGIGRCFFVHLAWDGSAVAENAAAALALVERVMGPVATLEARRAAGSGLLVQARHDAGGITQLTLRASAVPRVMLDLDGEAGSLRLDEAGRVTRHFAGAVAEIAPQPAETSPADPTRLVALLRWALSEH